MFIAFYEESDFNSSHILLMKNTIELVKKHENNLSFYWYKDKIPQEIKEQFYLHYYTLPKLKFFKDYNHETYNGSKSLVMLEKWYLKKNE